MHYSLQDHVGLNYVFELSQSFDAHGHPLLGTERIIDSWNFGNPTRFLNHPEPGTTANCTARSMSYFFILVFILVLFSLSRVSFTLRYVPVLITFLLPVFFV